jgi:hypothetical protein
MILFTFDSNFIIILKKGVKYEQKQCQDFVT